MAKLEGVKVIDMARGVVTKIAYEGEIYEFTEGNPKIGDIIEVDDYWRRLDKGDMFLCVGLDYDGDAKDSIGNSNYRKHYRVLRKVYAPSLDARVDGLEKRVSTLESDRGCTQSTGRIYDKPAQEGDTIRIIDSQESEYDNGDTMIVEHIDSDDDVSITDKYDGYIANYEFTIIGRKGKTEERKPELGDIVVITANTNGSRNNVGDIGKVVDSVLNGGSSLSVDVPGNPAGWGISRNYTLQSEMRLADETERAMYRIRICEINMSAGDYAKVVGETRWSDIDVGEIVKVEEYHTHFGEYKVRLMNGRDYDMVKPVNLEKIVADDRALSFLRVGRKVDEVKEGDIVEIVENTNYSSNKVGDIGVVKEYGGTEPYVNVSGRKQGRGYNHTKTSDIKLIAPVESRVDINAE